MQHLDRSAPARVFGRVSAFCFLAGQANRMNNAHKESPGSTDCNPMSSVRSVLLVLLFLNLSRQMTSETLYTPPALPVAHWETSVASTPVTGKILVVPTSSDMDKNGLALQKAIDDASYGDAIILQPHAVYRTGSLELRNKSGDGWITIESASAYEGLLPEGVRVSPMNESEMPVLISPGGNVPPILTASGAHNYRLIGLEVTKLDPASFIQEMVVIDAYSTKDAENIATLTDFPRDIIIDRCYIHGLPGSDMKRGIRMHCFECGVVDSYVSEAHVVGQDSQAIMFGGRSITIHNNYLEGASENLFAADYLSLRTSTPLLPPTLTTTQLANTEDLEVGEGLAFFDGVTNLYTTVRSISGSAVTYDPLQALPSANAIAYWGLLPTDVEISDNYLFKPLGWKTESGYHPLVKNLFELKSGRRIWFHDNVLENTWTDGQTGAAVLLTVRNENDQCYFCAIEDVTFENNIVRGANFGMGLLKTDYIQPSGLTRRVLIRNNLWINIASSFSIDAVDDLYVDHNTAMVGSFAVEIDSDDHPKDDVFINNIFGSVIYSGFHYPNQPNWNEIMPGLVLKNNLMLPVSGVSPYIYFPPNVPVINYTVDRLQDIGFNNAAAGDYSLSQDSIAKKKATDGTDLGADVTGLMAHESGVAQPAGSTPPVEALSQHLERLFLDPCTLSNPNSPTTIDIGLGESFGIAHLVWNAPMASSIEIHVGSPAGPLFAAGGPRGSAVTGVWVTDGTTFYLQDRTGDPPLDYFGTLAILRVRVEMVRLQIPRPRTLASFFLDPQTSDPNSPTTIDIGPGQTLGIGRVLWNAPTASSIEIHVGSPTGTLFAAGGAEGAAVTGAWVTDGMTFYLQDRTNGRMLNSLGTLAILPVHLKVVQNQTPPSNSLASLFLNPQVSDPNSPTTIQSEPGQTMGIAHLAWDAPTTSSIEIHVGSPAGPLFAAGGRQGSAVTGVWVTDGMTFYLQDCSNDKALNYFGTLATLSVHLETTRNQTPELHVVGNVHPASVRVGSVEARQPMGEASRD
jgi:hypothetical protein